MRGLCYSMNTINFEGDAFMTNDEIYQKYLYGIFKRNDNANYYFNKEANEVRPGSESLEDTSYYDLYYIVKNKFGIYDINGFYTSDFLYNGKFIWDLNGYILVERTYNPDFMNFIVQLERYYLFTILKNLRYRKRSEKSLKILK